MPTTSSRKLSLEFILNDEPKSRKGLLRENEKDRRRRIDAAVGPPTIQHHAASNSHTPISLRDLAQHQSQSLPSSSGSVSGEATSTVSLHNVSNPSESYKQQTKSFLCEICSREFAEKGKEQHCHQYLLIQLDLSFQECLTSHVPSTIGNLNKHISSVHLKEKKKICNVPGCGKSFAFRDGLIRHITLVHNNERQHECSICGKCFKQPSHLSKHLRTIHKQ